MRELWDTELSGEDEEQAPPGPKPRPSSDAIRSWLAIGAHAFAIDPRRRTGRHEHVRRLLLDGQSSATDSRGRWKELVSALQRHTMHSGLAQLSAAERQIITLAYLEGQTNRQIAATMGVSVATARRHLWQALERLEQYVRHSGTWVSAALLAGLAYLDSRGAKLGHMAEQARSAEWTQPLVAVLAAGGVATVVVGLAIATPQNSALYQRLGPVTARSSALVHTFHPRSIRLAARAPWRPPVTLVHRIAPPTSPAAEDQPVPLPPTRTTHGHSKHWNSRHPRFK